MKTLQDCEIDKIADNFEDQVGRIRADKVFHFSSVIIAEFCRINGLTAESAEQREQGQTVDRSDSVNLARNLINADMYEDITPTGVRILCEAVLDMDAALLITTPTPPAGVPDGFVLVPVEPTLDMGWAYLDAANASSSDKEHSFNHAGYRAMLSAAPQPEDTPAIFKEQAS